MGLNQTNVSPAHLSATSSEFLDIGAVAQQTYNNQIKQLDQLGDFAGDDPVGEQFKAQWMPGIEAVQTLLSGFQKLMGGVGINLANTASLYAHSNDVNTELAGEKLV